MVPPSCKPPRPAPITYRIPLLSLSAFRRRATKEARYPDRHTHSSQDEDDDDKIGLSVTRAPRQTDGGRRGGISLVS